MAAARSSRDDWRKRVERWKDSGLTAVQFASVMGINAGTIGPEVKHLMAQPETRTPPETSRSGEQGRTETGAPVRSAWDVGPDTLLDALRRNRWSPSATATALQIPRTTLYALMDRHPAIRKASTIPSDES
jgi:DNA-binding NtrC family response regulator